MTIETFVAKINYGKDHADFFIFMVYEREAKNNRIYYSGNAFNIDHQNDKPKENDLPLFSYSFNRYDGNWQSVADIRVGAPDENLELLVKDFFPDLIVGFRGYEETVE